MATDNAGDRGDECHTHTHMHTHRHKHAHARVEVTKYPKIHVLIHLHAHEHTCSHTFYHESSTTQPNFEWKCDASDQKKERRITPHHHPPTHPPSSDETMRHQGSPTNVYPWIHNETQDLIDTNNSLLMEQREVPFHSFSATKTTHQQTRSTDNGVSPLSLK